MFKAWSLVNGKQTGSEFGGPGELEHGYSQALRNDRDTF